MDIIKELYKRNKIFFELNNKFNSDSGNFARFDYYVYGNFAKFVVELINYKSKRTVTEDSLFSTSFLEQFVKYSEVDSIIDDCFRSISDLLELDRNWVYRDLIETTFFEEMIELNDIDALFQRNFSTQSLRIWDRYRENR